jgi:hypothetical protein
MRGVAWTAGVAAVVVVSAWNHQLVLNSVDDPRMPGFIVATKLNPEIEPEVGAPCTGGVGQPSSP